MRSLSKGAAITDIVAFLQRLQPKVCVKGMGVGVGIGFHNNKRNLGGFKLAGTPLNTDLPKIGQLRGHFSLFQLSVPRRQKSQYST